MSIEPTRIIRYGAHSLSQYAYILIRRDMPLPDRLMALEMLRIYLDQMIHKNPPSPEDIEAVVEYMRQNGYDIEPPGDAKELKYFIKGIDSENEVAKWFHSQLKRRDDEDILDYMERVSKFVVRILAIYQFISPDYTEM